MYSISVREIKTLVGLVVLGSLVNPAMEYLELNKVRFLWQSWEIKQRLIPIAPTCFLQYVRQ